MWVSWRGHLDVVGLLLKCNPDINAAAKVYNHTVAIRLLH